MACPTITGLGDGVFNQIEGRLNRIDTLSNTALAELKSTLLSLEQTASEAVNNVDYVPDVQAIPPVDAELDIPPAADPFQPEPPPDTTVSNYQGGYSAPLSLVSSDPPTFDIEQPGLDAPARPSRSRPGNPPAPPTAPAIPDAPVAPSDDELTLGPAPAIYQPRQVAMLQPDIDRVEALIEALLAKIPAPGEAEAMIDRMVASAESMLPDMDAWIAGKIEHPNIDWKGPLSAILGAPYDRLGLPATVEDAMRGRAFDAEDRNAQQAEQQAVGAWLARGFTLPGSVLNAQLTAVRNEAWSKKGAANRDVFIETARLAATQLIEAIKLGEDAETRYWDTYAKLMQVISATLMARLNAFGQVLTSMLESLKLAFSAPSMLTQLELTKTDINKGNVDVERLQVEASGLAMQAYETEGKAISTRAGVFESITRVFTGKLQAIGLVYDQYKAEISAFTADIQAFIAEWEAYGKEWGGEQTRQQSYQSAVSAFAERVRARGIEADTAKSLEGFKIDVEKLNQQTWALGLDAVKTRLLTWTESEKTRLAARQSGQQDQVIELDGRKAQVDVQMRNSDINSRNKLSEIELTLKRADIQMTKAAEVARLTVGVYDALSRASSQLVAGAMSAMNLGASISSDSRLSSSVSCDTNYSYRE